MTIDTCARCGLAWTVRHADYCSAGQPPANPYPLTRGGAGPVQELDAARARRSVAHVHDRTLAEQGIGALLRLLGRDPDTDDGVRDTPQRFVKALLEMGTSQASPAALLSTSFADTGYDAMVAVGPVPFVSLCEHHLLPFPGTAWLAYVPGPDGKVVGLSKLPRLLDHFASRPQVQERLTNQIADALEQHLQPLGAAVLIRAEHGCMTHRGVRKPGASMVTSVLRGVFLDEAETRAEFLAMTRGT